MQDNDFNNIFKSAAEGFRETPSPSVWAKLMQQQEASLSYRHLHWIWPVRIAVALIFVFTTVVGIVSNYDNIDFVSEEEPVDYEKLAIELKLMDPLVEVQNEVSDQENLPSNPKERSKKTVLSTLVDEQSSSTYSASQNLELASVKVKAEPSANQQGEIKHKSSIKEESALETTSGSFEPTLILPVLGFRFNLDRPQLALTSQQEIGELKLKPIKRWYFEADLFFATNDMGFKPNFVLPLYNANNPDFSYIPSENPAYSQKIESQNIINFELGYNLNDSWGVYSGLQFESVEGKQTAVLDVEEQHQYTILSSYPVSQGVAPVLLEENVVKAKTVKDTIFTSFEYSTWSVPIGVTYNLRMNRWHLFGGPQFGLTFGYKFESNSYSSRFSELKSNVLVQDLFSLSGVSYGAIAGVGYSLSKSLSLNARVSAVQHKLIGESAIREKSHNVGQLGLGIRYSF